MPFVVFFLFGFQALTIYLKCNEIRRDLPREKICPNHSDCVCVEGEAEIKTLNENVKYFFHEIFAEKK